MRRLAYLLPFILISLQAFSCAERKKINRLEETNVSSDQYTVFIINNSIHTGIVVPIDGESTKGITALKYFKDFRFADFGWGEEVAYQDTEDNNWHYVKAVIIPNTSVICIEGYKNTEEIDYSWSDFKIQLALSKEQFIKLINFIDGSFKKDDQNELLITSKRHSDKVIFFRSIYKYHLFNTCNTWVAKALQSTGLDVSPFFVITANQLYNEIKDKGTVIKHLK